MPPAQLGLAQRRAANYQRIVLQQSPVSVHRRLRSAVTSCRAHSRLVVATSEHWWEDEQEFDAITEVLLPKQVYITTPQAASGSLTYLQLAGFAAGFAAPSCLAEGQQLWQQLGRAGPPLFLKMRTRSALDDATECSPAAVDAFWQELCGQSWRTELDHGLGGTTPTTEPILLLCSSSSAVERLTADIPLRANTTTAAAEATAAAAAAAREGTAGGQQPAGGVATTTAAAAAGHAGVVVVHLQGWNEGEVSTQQKLNTWRQLQPVAALL